MYILPITRIIYANNMTLCTSSIPIPDGISINAEERNTLEMVGTKEQSATKGWHTFICSVPSSSPKIYIVGREYFDGKGTKFVYYIENAFSNDPILFIVFGKHRSGSDMYMDAFCNWNNADVEELKKFAPKLANVVENSIADVKSDSYTLIAYDFPDFSYDCLTIKLHRKFLEKINVDYFDEQAVNLISYFNDILSEQESLPIKLKIKIKAHYFKEPIIKGVIQGVLKAFIGG